MNITCLTKTTIKTNDYVRIILLSNNTMFTKEEAMQSSFSNTHYKIVGLPFKGVLSESGYFSIPKTKESEQTLNSLLFQNDNIIKLISKDNVNPWRKIQEEIFNGKLYEENKVYSQKKASFQFAVIEENVYQMLLKEDYQSWLGQNIEEIKSKINKDIEKLPLENLILPNYAIKAIEDEKDLNKKNELNSFFKENQLDLKFITLNGVFCRFFQEKIISKSYLNNTIDSLIDSYYAINVLYNNGCYLSPFNVLKAKKQTYFSNLLLKEQETRLLEEDIEENIPLIEKKYSISKDKLTEELNLFHKIYLTNIINKNITSDTWVDLNSENELVEFIRPHLPDHIKTILITVGDK